LRLGLLETLRELSSARISIIWGEISGWGLIAIPLGICLGSTTRVVPSSWVGVVGYAAAAVCLVFFVDLIVTTSLESRKGRPERLRQRAERVRRRQSESITVTRPGTGDQRPITGSFHNRPPAGRTWVNV